MNYVFPTTEQRTLLKQSKDMGKIKVLKYDVSDSKSFILFVEKIKIRT